MPTVHSPTYQIAERERLLTEWQARLDRKGAELEEAQRAAEVRGGCLCCGGVPSHAVVGPYLRFCCASCLQQRRVRPEHHASHHRPSTLLPWVQKKIAARDEASLAREKGALATATELEERVAAFDTKEKKALRVGGWVGVLLGRRTVASTRAGARQVHAKPLLLGSLAHSQPRMSPTCPPQELSDRESALAARESKLSQQHAELADRSASLELAKSRLETDRRQLEQREEALASAQAEVRALRGCWCTRHCCWQLCLPASTTPIVLSMPRCSCARRAPAWSWPAASWRTGRSGWHTARPALQSWRARYVWVHADGAEGRRLGCACRSGYRGQD